eukprot:scaffold96059_cov32-Attheya_sp.AAC.3
MDPYVQLGLTWGATTTEIKEAYNQLARKLLGIKGGPTQDSDGNTDGVKDESVVESRIVDGSI